MTKYDNVFVKWTGLARLAASCAEGDAEATWRNSQHISSAVNMLRRTPDNDQHAAIVQELTVFWFHFSEKQWWGQITRKLVQNGAKRGLIILFMPWWRADFFRSMCNRLLVWAADICRKWWYDFWFYLFVDFLYVLSLIRAELPEINLMDMDVIHITHYYPACEFSVV